ncbi:S1/P1 Nuclease [Terrimonas sp.]|uniref:zinc dependent phospholipase C family protein n=1 Tax=Terrimonas sp. TaxID=1914338 RepID=UPI000D51B1A8|nr:zinc dependent phospholipase C family protein [Terrimonas sp.]PVD51171.1 S1/P1 Nuclease [Terrimonas sp.]
MHRKLLFLITFTFIHQQIFCWGFYAHKVINHQAVFLLPPSMMGFYKPKIDFITEHAVDPDKRRYIVTQEGPRHFIDLNTYGVYPFTNVPRRWKDAVDKFGEDSLYSHGIVPWWINSMQQRLTNAFQQKNYPAILKLSAELAHYIGDAHVPLHTHNNYNGQLTGQQGIHGFWESRIPELLAEKSFDYFIGKATYIKDPLDFAWKIVLQSASAADSVLLFEKRLSDQYLPDQKYAFEERNGMIVKQYSSSFAITYNDLLNDMVQRRMRQSIFAVASLWYTAWVNAGQPQLEANANIQFTASDSTAFKLLDAGWQSGKSGGRTCEN